MPSPSAFFYCKWHRAANPRRHFIQHGAGKGRGLFHFFQRSGVRCICNWSRPTSGFGLPLFSVSKFPPNIYGTTNDEIYYRPLWKMRPWLRGGIYLRGWQNIKINRLNTKFNLKLRSIQWLNIITIEVKLWNINSLFGVAKKRGIEGRL